MDSRSKEQAAPVLRTGTYHDDDARPVLLQHHYDTVEAADRYGGRLPLSLEAVHLDIPDDLEFDTVVVLSPNQPSEFTVTTFRRVLKTHF